MRVVIAFGVSYQNAAKEESRLRRFLTESASNGPKCFHPLWSSKTRKSSLSCSRLALHSPQVSVLRRVEFSFAELSEFPG